MKAASAMLCHVSDFGICICPYCLHILSPHCHYCHNHFVTPTNVHVLRGILSKFQDLFSVYEQAPLQNLCRDPSYEYQFHTTNIICIKFALPIQVTHPVTLQPYFECKIERIRVVRFSSLCYCCCCCCLSCFGGLAF